MNNLEVFRSIVYLWIVYVY